MQFPAGILPPRPHSVKLVYDLEGAGIEAKSQLKNEITPTRPDEDRLRVIASPRKDRYASVECISNITIYIFRAYGITNKRLHVLKQTYIVAHISNFIRLTITPSYSIYYIRDT